MTELRPGGIEVLIHTALVFVLQRRWNRIQGIESLRQHVTHARKYLSMLQPTKPLLDLKSSAAAEPVMLTAGISYQLHNITSLNVIKRLRAGKGSAGVTLASRGHRGGRDGRGQLAKRRLR